MTTAPTPHPAVGFRIRGLFCTFLLTTAVVALIANGTPAQAAATPASEALSISSSATAAARSATQVRKEANATLQGYLDDYGDRLSATERGRVTYWQRTGDRSLRQVQIQARRTAALARNGASPTRVNAARERAITAHAQARRDVDAALDELVPVLTTRLSFMELLQARTDLESSLAGLDRLGQELQAIPIAAR